ncbi:hypothetical protein Dimus_024112 [Dionaea muscipula]
MDEGRADVKKKRKISQVLCMECLSCEKCTYRPCWTTANGVRYTTKGPGTCKECYLGARDTAVKLRREIEELKANVDFLRHSPPSSHDDPIQYHPARSSPLSSDVTLVASDDSPDSPILANKFVLASRSPVFKAMLEIAMKESIRGTIKISGITHDSLPPLSTICTLLKFALMSK